MNDEDKSKLKAKLISSYNNFYMFRNPLRFFLNVDQFDYSILEFNNNTNETKKIKQFCARTCPVDFFVRKYTKKDAVRNLKLPNIYNFRALFNEIIKENYFIEYISKLEGNREKSQSRLYTNINGGNFKENIYNAQVTEDLNYLIKYDSLFKMDIKSFYASIYTHKLSNVINKNIQEFLKNDKMNFDEKFYTNCNNGNTNEMILGNYASLLLVEIYLEKIFSDFKREDCHLEYFSDDIYLFCDKINYLSIKTEIFKLLQKNNLFLNESKTEIFNYISYTKKNKLLKYWNKIKKIDKNANDKKSNNKSCIFLNQLIYRVQLIDEENEKRTFIVNFFKSNEFQEIELGDYFFSAENTHQLLFLFREYPESILYVTKKLLEIDNDDFKNNIMPQFISFFKDKFEKSLNNLFYEEQLYFYFGYVNFIKKYNKVINFEEEILNKIISSNNQVLQSFFVIYHGLNIEFSNDESKWLINYTLLSQKFNEKDLIYLCPKEALGKGNPKDSWSKSYAIFFKNNINNGVSIISPIDKVQEKIDYYLSNKF